MRAPKVKRVPDASSEGRLNPHVQGLNRSATLAINEKCADLRARGVNIFQMGFGQSPFPVPPIMVEALRQHADEKAYLPVQGLPELREAIVGYYHRTEGLDYAPNHVLVGPGTKELMFILQLVYAAEILIPSPSWVSYAPQASIIGRTVRWLPTAFSDGLCITPDQLDQVCRRDPGRNRLLFMNYPGNPTGTTYTAAQLEGIAEVARKYGVLILSDEIYSGLQFNGEHVSIARFYPEGTIVSNGLSKWCGAGGWRLGAFALHENLEWLAEAMTAVASETFTSVAAPIQYAAITGFSGGPQIDGYVSGCRRILSGLLGVCAKRLRETGAVLCEPQGGFYLFPCFNTVPAIMKNGRPTTSGDLCRRILDDTGVTLLPGSDFGRAETELSVRIATVDFDGGPALEAVSKLPPNLIPDEVFLQRYCTPVIDGMARICDWLNAQ
jgi:aspartate aminotransferase